MKSFTTKKEAARLVAASKNCDSFVYAPWPNLRLCRHDASNPYQWCVTINSECDEETTRTIHDFDPDCIVRISTIAETAKALMNGIRPDTVQQPQLDLENKSLINLSAMYGQVGLLLQDAHSLEGFAKEFVPDMLRNIQAIRGACENAFQILQKRVLG